MLVIILFEKKLKIVTMNTQNINNINFVLAFVLYVLFIEISTATHTLKIL